jgi:hypothetical protein
MSGSLTDLRKIATLAATWGMARVEFCAIAL